MIKRTWIIDLIGSNPGAVLKSLLRIMLKVLLTMDDRTVVPGHLFHGFYDASCALY